MGVKQSEQYDEGYSRIFGDKPVGPLARALQREQEERARLLDGEEEPE